MARDLGSRWRWKGRGVFAVCVVASVCASSAAFAATPPSAARTLAECLHDVVAAVPEPAKSTLPRIAGPERQLLAARAYLRNPDLAQRWSWNARQAADYARSPEYAQAMSELAKVQARFAADNPGHRLHVNVQLRTLDVQLQRWNDNASVGRTAAALRADAESACATASPDAFVDWLRGWQPNPPPNLAAPGLSPHGQGRAYDFQVYAGDRLVAGTDSSRIALDWRQGGWATRLADAVRAASPSFQGPLTAPDEPWHYAYVPIR